MIPNSLLLHFPLLAQAATTAAASGTPAASGSQPPLPIIPIAIFCILFYMLILRPQFKKSKDAKVLASSLKTGDQVVTIGGIHGLVTNVQESTVTVKVADNVKIKFQRTAIDQIVKPAPESATETAPATT